MKARILLAILSVVLAAGVARGAGWYCYTEWGITCPVMKLSICPAGDYELISRGGGGTEDYIWVAVRDDANHGIPGVPWTDYWIDACTPAQALHLCAQPIVADSLTNWEGRTTFSLTSLSLGGCELTGGLKMAVQGVYIKQQPQCAVPVCLPIIIKGPDLAKNGLVDLSDLGVFGDSFNKSPGQTGYSDCCDFNDDGKCNLSDFAFFSQHYGHNCM